MDVIAALCISIFCCVWAGARNLAYMLYFVSVVPFISLSAVEGGLTSSAGLSGGNVQFKLAVRAACTVGFLLVLARQKDSLRYLFRACHLPIIALVAWGMTWVFRSQQPLISLFRLIELFSFFMAGVALLVEVGQHRSLRTLLRWHCLALWTLPLLGLWFSFQRPELAQHSGAEITRWGHKLLNANSLGFACTIVILWATSEIKRGLSMTKHGSENSSPVSHWKGWLLTWAPLLTCIYVLVMARSRTAMVTMLLGQMILWWPRGRVGLAHVRFLLMGCIGASLIGWQWPLVEQWMLRGESAESLASATGRTSLWQGLLTDQVPKSPIAGAGYLMLSGEGGFWHAGRIWTNAHNTYIFSLVSAGLVGFALVLAIVASAWWSSLKIALNSAPSARDSATLLFALQCVLLATSVTGFGVFGFPNPAMFFFYALYPLVFAKAAQVLPERRADHSPARSTSNANHVPLLSVHS